MRFAGDDIAAYLGTGPDMSAMAQNEHMRDARETISGYKNEAEVASAGVTQYGKTFAHDAIMDAKSGYDAATQQASNMQQIGGMIGQGISGLGGLFRGGGGGAFGIGQSFSGLSGYDSGLDWASNSVRSYF